LGVMIIFISLSLLKAMKSKAAEDDTTDDYGCLVRP
jgi:hypothetical protein